MPMGCIAVSLETALLVELALHRDLKRREWLQQGLPAEAASIAWIETSGTDGTVRDIEDLKGPHPELESAAEQAVGGGTVTGALEALEPVV